VLISGISKGGFGGGVGFVAVPLMALLISPIQAAAIMLPILCAMDVFGLWAYRRVWHRRNIAIMIPGAALGIAIGALSFRYLDESLVRLMIGAIAVAFALQHWIRGKAAGEPRRPSVAWGGVWSLFAGFTSFVAHAGGPPTQLYLLPQRMDRTLFVGTTVIFYFFLNYAKLVPYGMLGQFTPENLATAAMLLPLTPLGVWLGFRLHRVVSEAWFYRLCYAMLFATGLKLLWDGFTPLT
jgi:hypothetical protein